MLGKFRLSLFSALNEHGSALNENGIAEEIKMKHKIGAFFLAFLMAMLVPIEGAYGIQFSTTGGGAGGSGSVSMNIRAGDSASVNSGVSINNAVITPTTRLIGATSLFEETHSVKDSTGKSASVYVKVANAPNGLTYSSKVLPGEGTVAAQSSVSAEQWLTVPKANSIVTKAASSYGTLSSDVGLEETKGPSTGDYVTLNGYDGFASASASSVSTSQSAASGIANSIRIYGDAKDSSGSYGINTQLTGISGGKATFNPLITQSSAGTTTQVTQWEHVNGGFQSKITAGSKTQTRTSNWGTDFDLNMLASKTTSGPYIAGVIGYYVNPTTSANKIQGAVNAAQSGDWINVLAGTYKENVNIDKSLTVNGAGAGKALVDGQLAGSVFTIGDNNPNIDVTLQGITIQNGKATNGGGILNECRLAVTDSTVSGNTATSLGGGIYNEGVITTSGSAITSNTANFGGGVFNNGGKVTLNGGSVSYNIAKADGGGIQNSGSSTLNVNGVSITDNSAKGLVDPYGYGWPTGWGGAIYNDGTATITGSTISRNSANWRGGGIYSYGSLTMTGSTISYNSAKNDGGGMLVDESSITNIADSAISNNIASNFGGGIYNDATMNLNRVTIDHNNAQSAAGMYNWGWATLTDSKITNNIATTNAGGFYNSDHLATIGGTTQITNNQAKTGYGGGIYADGGSVTLSGINVGIKNNMAHLPSSQSSWKKGWGIYDMNNNIITNNGFNAAAQAVGNTRI